MKKVLALLLSCLMLMTLSVPLLPVGAADGDFGGYVVKELGYQITGLRTVDPGGLMFNPGLALEAIDLSAFIDTATGKFKSTIALEFDFFTSGNFGAHATGSGQIEFTSSGRSDQQEINYNIAQLNAQMRDDQWVRYTIPLSSFGWGNESTGFDASKINFMRIYHVGVASQYCNQQMTIKIVKMRFVDLTKTVPTLEQNPLGDGSFIAPTPTWRLAPVTAGIERDDLVVIGYNLADFLQAPYMQGYEAGVTDVTIVVQSLLDGLERAGGGTLFVPSGQYCFRSSLTIPIGVTLCGEWKNPDTTPAIGGTIFKIYGGKNDKGGAPFITLSNSCSVRDVAFWYPEQSKDSFIPYPPTIRGGSYSHVRNVTFVNSYIAMQQGPGMSGCPNLYNAYGTPLDTGLDIDGIADIGRYDIISFSPKYWAKSGLAGAPGTAAEEEAFRRTLQRFSSGVILRRIDWSFLTYYKVEGYHIGLGFARSYCSENNPENNPAQSYSFPNGHCYGLTFDDCDIAIWVEGVSGAGELLANVDIRNCYSGIVMSQFATSAADGGNVMVADAYIDAIERSVEQGSKMKLNIVSSTIAGGVLYAESGALNITDCDFTWAASEDEPHILLERGTHNAVILGNRFEGKAYVYNEGRCPSAIDHTPVETVAINQLSSDYTRTKVAKPPKADLFVVTADTTGLTDATEAIQAQLTAAKNNGGGVVFLPPGMYRLDGNLTVDSNVELKGAVDVGRVPYKVGSVLNVYGGRVAPNAQGVPPAQSTAAPTVVLKEKAGIRGIIFNYPEQFPLYQPDNKPLGMSAYPYAMQGQGKDIYVVNVSLRNGYNGLDMFTYKCDNHYVDYLAGVALKNAIRVGKGAEGGTIMNMQVNYNAMNNGASSGWGVWDNSVNSLPSAQQSATQERDMLQVIQGNAIVLWVGDVKDQILFNSFSYSGKRGILFDEENGKGASGWLVGHGVDYGRCAIEIRALGDMQMINTQLTAFNTKAMIDVDGDGKTDQIVYNDGEDGIVHDIYIPTGFTGQATFVNFTVWAQPTTAIRVDSGALHVYNCNINSTSNEAFELNGTGKLDITGLNLNRANSSSALLRPVDGQRPTAGNLTVNGGITNSQPVDLAQVTGAKNLVRRVNRWDVSWLAELGDNDKLAFTEDFKDYPNDTRNGVPKAFTTGGSFQTVTNPSANANITLASVDGEDCARFFQNGKNAASSALSMQSTDPVLEVGKDISLYHVEMRLKISSLVEEGAFVELSIYRGNNSQTLVSFDGDGMLRAADTGEDVCEWETGKWYRVVVEVDLRNTNNKTCRVILMDDEYATIESSEALPLSGNFEGDSPFNRIGILSYAPTQDEGSTKVSQIDVDYLFVSYNEGLMLGDVDGSGKVDSTDARMVLQHEVHLITLTDAQQKAANVNKDSKVDSTDARMILQKEVGLTNF